MIIPQTSDSFPQVAEIITSGGVIAFRTDTFYGLGADPFNDSAIKKIIELKGREERKPILVVISDPEHLQRLIPRASARFEALAKRFWPGPLTIIGPADPKLPAGLTAGAKTVGVRLPGDDKVRSLVRGCGGMLTATSANSSGSPPARTAAEVYVYFGDRIEMILDDGAAKTDQPSTVVEATSVDLKLIREGVIPWTQIQASLESKR